MPEDVYSTNPWFIDSSGDKSTSLPTYNGNTGTHNTYHIYKIIWFGVTTAGDDLVIKDIDDNVKIQGCSATANGRQYDFGFGLAIKGLNVETMDTGDILVYHS